eukprot:597052-Pleurochrysis_carterae.AAC.1
MVNVRLQPGFKVPYTVQPANLNHPVLAQDPAGQQTTGQGYVSFKWKICKNGFKASTILAIREWHICLESC